MESLPLGTERRPRNLIMGVCLRRTLVARIFAVVCGVCGVLRKRFVLVKKCGCARASARCFFIESSERRWRWLCGCGEMLLPKEELSSSGW